MSKNRKPLHKRWWVWLIVAIAVFFSFSLFAPPEERFGLTTQERQAVFGELRAAESRANAQADSEYPNDATQAAQRAVELQSAYFAEVRSQYGLDEAAQGEIVQEGIEERW